MRRRLLPHSGRLQVLLTALLVFCLSLPAEGAAQTAAQREDKIKAALIFKLIKIFKELQNIGL